MDPISQYGAILRPADRFSGANRGVRAVGPTVVGGGASFLPAGARPSVTAAPVQHLRRCNPGRIGSWMRINTMLRAPSRPSGIRIIVALTSWTRCSAEPSAGENIEANSEARGSFDSSHVRTVLIQRPL